MKTCSVVCLFGVTLVLASGASARLLVEGEGQAGEVRPRADLMLRMKPHPIGTCNLLQVDTLFADDFESGLSSWVGDWGLTDEHAHSPDSSFTESPYANSPNLSDLFSSMASGVDLSGYLGAALVFWNVHWLEEGFDYGYLEVSTDGGSSWIVLKTRNDTLDVWTPDTTDLGGFCGNSDVRVGFRVVTDPAYTEEGWFVDDVLITGSMEDHTPPLIIHRPPADTESVPQDLLVVAQITDMSGLASDSLYYRFDGGAYVPVTHDSASGDTYYFTVPESPAGTFVDYYLTATDGASPPNRGETVLFSYVAGTVVYYDDGEEEFVYGYGPGWRVAVRFSHGADSALVATGLYRFYRDTTHPLDSVWIHLWDDAGGIPGADMIPRFKIWPSNTPDQPMAWTKVDLRPYGVIVPAADFHLGCEFLSSYPYMSGDDPPASGRSNANDGSGWFPNNNDAYIRVVVGLNPVGIQEILEARCQTPASRLGQNYPNPFGHTTTIPFRLPSRHGDAETRRPGCRIQDAGSHITLAVYDLAGRLVRTLIHNEPVSSFESSTRGGFASGEPVSVLWDGRNESGEEVASGIYFYRLQTQGFLSTRSMVVLR